jgi:DNA end-binding protein Ku
MASVWTGYLTFGMVTLPVRLFSGARSERIRFRLLHEPDHVRLRQQLVCPLHQRPVDREEVVRGFEYGRDEYVVLDDEEIRRAAPLTRHQMEIVEFCHSAEIDPVWFESSYYLTAESAGGRAYALLEDALRASHRVGVCRVSMHNREYTGVLRPSDLAGLPAPLGSDGHLQRRHGLLLHTLYYEDELRVAEGFGERGAADEPRPEELALARQVIEHRTHPFDPRRYQDRYRQNLQQLISDRLEGRTYAAPKKPAQPATGDLLDSLKRSLG